MEVQNAAFQKFQPRQGLGAFSLCSLVMGVTFIAARSLWKLEGWRLYVVTGGAGAVAAAVFFKRYPGSESSEKLSDNWLGRFNRGEELSRKDQEILKNIEHFRPQWFDVLDKEKVVPLIKLLPNLKVLSFQRSADMPKSSCDEFDDLDGLVDEVFSDSRTSLEEFIPNYLLLKKMLDWVLESDDKAPGDLRPEQEKCLAAVTGFACSASSQTFITNINFCLEELFPYLTHFKWLNLSNVDLGFSNTLFLRSESGKEFLNNKEVFHENAPKNTRSAKKIESGWHCFVRNVLRGDALEFLKASDNLRFLSVISLGEQVNYHEQLLGLLKDRKNLHFECPRSEEFKDFDAYNKAPLKLCRGEEISLPKEQIPGATLSWEDGGFSKDLTVAKEELKKFTRLFSGKPLCLMGAAETDLESIKVILDVLSPSSIQIAKSIGKEGLEEMARRGYQIQAQNVMTREICPIFQTGVEQWEDLDGKSLQEHGDIEKLFQEKQNLKGHRFSLLFIK